MTNPKIAELAKRLREDHLAVITAEKSLAELETSYGWNKRNEVAECAIKRFDKTVDEVIDYMNTLLNK